MEGKLFVSCPSDLKKTFYLYYTVIHFKIPRTALTFPNHEPKCFISPPTAEFMASLTTSMYSVENGPFSFVESSYQYQKYHTIS